MSAIEPGARAKRKRRRRAYGPSGASLAPRHLRGTVGGRYQPLNPFDLPKIDQAVRSILADVGMAEAPEIVIEQVTRAGGRLDAEGRLHFSSELIENALDGLSRDFTLCGQNPEHDMQLGVGRVHVGSH